MKLACIPADYVVSVSFFTAPCADCWSLSAKEVVRNVHTVPPRQLRNTNARNAQAKPPLMGLKKTFFECIFSIAHLKELWTSIYIARFV